MLQLKCPTDFFSSDCLTFSLSKPKKKKKKKRYYDTEKGRWKKKKKTCDPVENRTAGHCHPLADLENQSILWYKEREGEKKKKALQSSGESCDQMFVLEVLRYEDRDRPLGSPPICSVFSFRKWGFCWEIHLGIIYDSGILVWLVMISVFWLGVVLFNLCK